MITKEELSALLGTEVGVCAFKDIKDALLPCRKAELIPNDAKSVLLFVFPYKVKEEKPQNISRYAAVPDYHNICKKALDGFCEILKKNYNDCNFVSFIDDSPIPEVTASVKAGLGVKGENGLLITREYGSFVFIGEIVTNMAVECENRYAECENCGLCEKACPVGLNKRHCLSALTQKKGELTNEETDQIKRSSCVWGCDICAEVCPMNKGKKLSEINEFINGYRDSYKENEDITGRAYAWRGEKVIKRNYEIIKNGEV